MMLLLPLMLPWFLAALVVALDGRRVRVAALAAAGMGLCFLATLRLALFVFQHGPVETTTGTWAAGVGIQIRADALSVLFALVTNWVLLSSLLYEALRGIEQRMFPGMMLFLAAGLTGLFLTADAFNFYVFFEVSMIAGFVLTSYGQQAREIRGALIFSAVNLLGSTLFLSGTAGLYHLTGTLNMEQIAARIPEVRGYMPMLVAVLIFTAFAVKLGLFPFHSWLPPVYAGAKPAVACILSGALANIGTYGLLRFGGGLLSNELRFGSMALVVLGALSILYGSILAVSRRSVGEVLAYSTIGQTGYVMMALAVGGRVGFAAAILYSVVNALNKGLLFLAAGMRGGWAGAAFAVGAFSLSGVPPALGFFSKAAVFRAGLEGSGPVVVAMLVAGSALSILYMFRAYQATYWESGGVEDGGRGMRMVVCGVAAVLLVAGIWPEPLLTATELGAAVLMKGIGP